MLQDLADSYGTRVTGYIVAPVTGEYSFAVSADDTAELYLSTDETAGNRALVASVNAATAFRDWDAQAGAVTIAANAAVDLAWTPLPAVQQWQP